MGKDNNQNLIARHGHRAIGMDTDIYALLVKLHLVMCVPVLDIALGLMNSDCVLYINFTKLLISDYCLVIFFFVQTEEFQRRLEIFITECFGKLRFYRIWINIEFPKHDFH